MPENLTVPDLLKALPEKDRGHAFEWWAKISLAEREELSGHWEESLQKDAKGLVLIGFDADRGYIFKGTFREGDDIDLPVMDDDEMFDYIFNKTPHTSFSTSAFTVARVCMAHPAARACLDQGLIPHDFKCPLADDECRMAAILAMTKGKALQLELIGSC